MPPKQTIPFSDLELQYQELKSEIDAAILGVIQSSQFINGDKVREFEQAFSALHDGQATFGVASGTDALDLAIQAYGFGPGDEIISQPNTWISTINAIAHVGATPVLVDVDPDTYQIVPEALEAAITDRTSAIIPVHMFGYPAPMDKILEVASGREIKIIEDVAQAPLAKVNGQTVGTFGDIACFSFYPSKNLGCFGDGGAIVVNDKSVVDKIAMLKNYGQSERFHHEVFGQNSRLDTLQAAVLLEKLKRLESWTEQRRDLASRYIAKLDGLPVKLPARGNNSEPVYHLFVLQIDHRDNCLEYLRSKGVMAQVHYPKPIHLQPCYAYLGHKQGDFPETEALSSRGISLPFFPGMTESQIDHVVDTLAEFFKGQSRDEIIS